MVFYIIYTDILQMILKKTFRGKFVYSNTLSKQTLRHQIKTVFVTNILVNVYFFFNIFICEIESMFVRFSWRLCCQLALGMISTD